MLGLLVVFALSLSAYYAYKTRSKIWRHGKANIYWDEPMVRSSESQDVQDWVSNVADVLLHISPLYFTEIEWGLILCKCVTWNDVLHSVSPQKT